MGPMEKIKLLLEAALQHRCDVCGSDQDSLDFAAAEAIPEIDALSSNVVYVAYFYTGEYDDAKEEPAKFFSSEDKARDYVDNQNNLLKEMGLHISSVPRKDFNDRHNAEVIEKFGFGIDYTGASYAMDGPYPIE